MTPTPPATSSSAGGGWRSPEEQFRVVRKRNRVPLSCNSCRTRNVSTSQSTTSQPMTDGDSSAAKQPRGSGTVMIDDDNDDDEDESDVDDHLAKSIGYLKVDADKGKSTYIGQQHWHLILSDIAEVKNYFTSHKKELETSYEKVLSSKPATAREGPTLLLGASPASEMELRSALPHKAWVLVLCSRYLNSMDHAVGVIHGPTFLQQLRDHWRDPSKTPIMWLGLLYSVLCLAMLSYQKVGDEPSEWQGRTLDLAAEYRMRTVQCLVKADYTKPVEYTVETMMLYVFGEYSSRWDADLGLWMIVSLTIRTAFRMGYHRDAKWFPSLTPFQAEMRRRTWALVRMADVIFSHQVSLPNMVYDHDCDTQLPNNIYDDEISPNIKELPPSRPVTEPTPVSYMIAKVRLCIELGNILQATNRVDKGVSYDEIMRSDARVRQIIQELPPHLKLGTLTMHSRDPVTLILARFNLDILSQKIMCLLHRKYLCRARQNPRYAHSRRSTVEASVRAMEHLQTLHRESQPGGPLHTVSWYVNSIATTEFILPAMLIVLDLHYDKLASQSGMPEDSEGAFRWTPEQRARMMGTLESAAIIWKSLVEGSIEAYKGAKTMEIMLQKLKEPAEKTTTGGPAVPQFQPQTAALSSLANSTEAALDSTMLASATGTRSLEGSLPNFSAQGDGSLNSFLNTNSSAFMGLDFSLPTPTLGNIPLDSSLNTLGSQSPMSMFTSFSGAFAPEPDFSSNVDWGAFENYAQMANWGADQSFQIYGGGDVNDQDNSMMNTQ
ncbi:hypothetical protein E4U21_001902 [Claviceps maximensis]|nr:hypothetical protein E4U21_001902 [Claviceps maximensis]